MLVPTIDLITVSDIWSTTIQDRLLYHNVSLHKTLGVHKVLDANKGNLELVSQISRLPLVRCYAAASGGDADVISARIDSGKRWSTHCVTRWRRVR